VSAVADPPTRPDMAIEVTGLVMRYGAHTAVAGLDLAVGAGRTLALLGPNGAGKTTTVETCVGLREPDAGTVRVLGLDPRVDGRRLRPRLGVMLQEQGVYPQARPREVLALQAAMFTDARDVDDLLDLVGLTESLTTRFRDLSGGQQQRLSLALALVGRPEVAFLDEPTAGLDPAARRATWDLVRGLQADGVTVVLTTHLLDEAEELADDVVIIDHGRVVAAGTPDDLVRADDVVFTTDVEVDRDDLSGRLGVAVERRGRRSHRLPVPSSPALLVALSSALADLDVTMTSLNADRRGLEDVFLRLTDPTNSRGAGQADHDDAAAATGRRNGRRSRRGR